jgi:Cu-processing system permease protein
MISTFWALAWNGFREARRNRVSVVVAIFVLAMLLSSSLVSDITVWTFERVLTNFGLGMMSIALTLLAVFLSSSLLAREIERRTLFLIVSKPVSRGAFIVGRLAGNMITLGFLLSVMSGLFFIQYKLLLGYDITIPQIQAIGMLMFELLVISSIGFLMSSFSSQMVSAMVTIGLFFAGHLSGDIYTFSSKSESAAVRSLGRTIYYLLPNLDRVNLRPMASYDIITPAKDVLGAAAYATGYSMVMVALAIVIFNRRDFK